jgi:hypothetical protein
MVGGQVSVARGWWHDLDGVTVDVDCMLGDVEDVHAAASAQDPVAYECVVLSDPSVQVPHGLAGDEGYGHAGHRRVGDTDVAGCGRGLVDGLRQRNDLLIACRYGHDLVVQDAL